MHFNYLWLVFHIIISTNAQIFNLTVDYIAEVNQIGQAYAFSHGLPTPNADEYIPTDQNSTEYGSFDYIIVGAGSAGAVLATRLSEDENLKILLLEAGGYESAFSDIPGNLIYLQGMRFNWNFHSVPQTTCCLGLKENRCAHPRGKVLGGSSTINALMYVRGNRKDYDGWERQGNPGWSYEHVLPYFLKSENTQIDDGDKGYHRRGGLWNVEHRKPCSPQTDAFIQANLELGRKYVDYNGREQLGVSRIQTSTLNGARQSTGRAFLSHASNRANLDILTEAYVTKILINRRKEAYGVNFDWKRASYVARAKKEVIVSAGAVMSPHLLMLSGIGPAAHLKSFGIPVIQNLEGVGSNYKNHACYYGLYFVTNYTEPARSNWELVRDYLEGRGPLTQAGHSQGIGFYQTKLHNTPGVPDIEMILIPANSTNEFMRIAYGYNEETYNTIYARIDNPRSFCIYMLLLHPESAGTVRLNSANPYEYPLVDPRFLSDRKDEDIERLYEGVQMALKLLDTRAFRGLNASLFYAPLPACQNYTYLSKDYWYCQLRQLTMHMYHPMGTCKMGPNPNNGAVVNHELKVHGIKGLRVADASVMPSTISGHTSAPSVMIGEKLADMLRGRRHDEC